MSSMELGGSNEPLYGMNPHRAMWRIGRKVRRTIYAMSLNDPTPRDTDPLIGVMDTPECAAEAVNAHNIRLSKGLA